MTRYALALASAILVGTPATAATFDFTAHFSTGPVTQVTGSYTLDGDTLVGIDLVIGETRFSTANSAAGTESMIFGTSFDVYGTLDGNRLLTSRFDDFELSISESRNFINPSAPRVTTIGFGYATRAGVDAFFTNEVTIVERSGTTAVPEPATWAMMIGGFGLMGGSLRRRRLTAARMLA